jgi:hypothetical protein
LCVLFFPLLLSYFVSEMPDYKLKCPSLSLEVNFLE